MNSVRGYYIIMLAALLAGCDLNSSAGEKKSGIKTKTFTSSDNSALNGATIKNDIELEATGVKVKEVYLLDADKNLLKEHITRVGERIYVVIKVDTGWVKVNGKSFVGASERISTSSGVVIVNADDIFKEYETTGLDAVDAKVISLSAVITEVKAGVENFVVQFRVWDKMGNGEIKGKYYFSLAK